MILEFLQLIHDFLASGNTVRFSVCMLSVVWVNALSAPLLRTSHQWPKNFALETVRREGRVESMVAFVNAIFSKLSMVFPETCINTS